MQLSKRDDVWAGVGHEKPCNVIKDIPLNLDWAMFVAFNRGRLTKDLSPELFAKYESYKDGVDVFKGYIANDRTQCLGEEKLLQDALEEKPNLPIGPSYDTESLFWMGYLYRYWHFLTNQSSGQIAKKCDAQTLNALYPAYHTLDCSQAVRRILEGAALS